MTNPGMTELIPTSKRNKMNYPFKPGITEIFATGNRNEVNCPLINQEGLNYSRQETGIKSVIRD
jgi:hypothetical protein